MDEILLNIVFICMLVFISLQTAKFIRYDLRRLFRRNIYSFANSYTNHKILALLDELNMIEARKTELKNGPNNLCNQGCNAKQKFLKLMYEENSKVLGHIQTILLIRLHEQFKQLKKKYEKEYVQLKEKYHLPDDDVKWNAELKQYS